MTSKFLNGQTIPTMRDGIVCDQDEDKAKLNSCCITAVAWECLANLYCRNDDEVLWAIDPCTPLASIACRDESQLREGAFRFAHSVWIGVGDKTEPKDFVGLVNFRLIGQNKGDPDTMKDWNLGCAEAFLRLPAGWQEEDVPIADERYIRALTPAVCPEGSGDFLKGIKTRPDMKTVPYSAQWSVSGTCSQTSTFMIAMHLCLPHGTALVEGPFSIAAFAEAVRESLGIKRDDYQKAIDMRKQHERRHESLVDDWSGATPDHIFDIREGADLITLAETLTRFLADSRRRSWTMGRPGLWPAHITSRKKPLDRSFPLEEYRRSLTSALSSGLPVMAQVDLELARAASVVATKSPKEEPSWQDYRELLDEAENILLEGKRPIQLPRKLVSEKKTYDPSEQVHCVVVIGAKGLLNGNENGSVLFHDPWLGPYCQASIKDFYVAAHLPYMLYTHTNDEKTENMKPEFVELPGEVQELGFGPVIDLVVPVPYHIGFDLYRLSRFKIPYHVNSDEERKQLEGLILCPSNDIEWRVRILKKSEVWDSYFVSPLTATEDDFDLEDLLPQKNPDCRHVLCLETYDTPEAADNGRPRTVVFAYSTPEAADTGSVTSSPKLEFTGGFGVDRSEQDPEVVFFQIIEGFMKLVSPPFICKEVVSSNASKPTPRG